MSSTYANAPPDAAEASDNRLLAGLPTAETVRLAGRLGRVDFAARDYVYSTGDRIAAVIFPQNGWLYQILRLRSGEGSEAGLIGAEGMVGLPLLFGIDHSSVDLMAHTACQAFRMESAAFRATLDDCPIFRGRILRYANRVLGQTMQAAACNAHHSLEQRLTRALLGVHDKTKSTRFMLTHELLGIMLGVRRAGITVAAGGLQKAGLIRYTMGQIEILDRAALEARSCECYATICETERESV